jgi:Uma2 family endonuclease
MAAEPKPRPLLEHWKFTVDDLLRMDAAGLFDQDHRVELIDGELIRMHPITPAHAGHVMRLNNRVLGERVREQALLSVQNPIQLRPRGQPQPDVMVLRRRSDFYTTSHVTAADVMLLIEVADSSLAYDRETKGAIYAQAGIADYWIVNLVDSQIIVLRQPVDGSYTSVQTLVHGDVVQPLAFPDIVISVSEILA